MQFRLLGRVEAQHDGSDVELGRRRERCLLGILLLEAGTTVSADRLVDLLWDGVPPGGARANLHAHISRLRGRIDPDGQGTMGIRLITRGGGYLVETDPERVDAHRFRALVSRAGSLSDPAERSATLSEALALWRGPLLADVASDRLRERIGIELTEGRMLATEMMIEAELAAGRIEEAIVELTALIAQYPMRERPRAQLMRALYQSGRQADALKVFADTRRLLIDELGVEPGPELQRVQRQILAGEADQAAGQAPADPAAEPATRRNDLPGDVADFTGREEEMNRLLDLLVRNTGAPAAVTISAFDGMAGIGKTALAVHAAHALSGRYPDLQLFINLRGHTVGQEPVTPATALDTLLRTLGVPPGAIPEDLDERSALWRAELANRRAVVVLDDATSAAQVRPLLPGTPTCLALITSRRRLTDLEAAHAVSLDVLPPGDAQALLRRVAGGERTAGDPAAVAEVVRLCGYLPLAIRISGARLRTRPAWTVRHLVERLAERRHRLPEFATGDRSVEAAFALSYEHLDADRQRLFRLLGLAPGAEFDAYLAAAVAELDLNDASLLLEDLVDVHLLQQPAPGRYRFHDLLREHAEAVATRTEPEPVRREATGRALDYYLHTTAVAMRRLDSREPVVTIQAARPPVHSPLLGDTAAALDWLDAEYGTLIAAVGYAAEHGWDAHAWQLPHLLQLYLNLRFRTADWLSTHRSGLAAARRLADRLAEAEMLKNLGLGQWAAGDSREAIELYRQALPIYRETGNQHGEGDTLNNLGLAQERLGQYEEALHSYQQALPVRLAVGYRRGEGATRMNLGNIYDRLGHPHEAIAHYQDTLAIFQAVGEERGVGIVLGNLGLVYARMERYDEAISAYLRSLEITGRSGDRGASSNNLTNLGNAYRKLGRHQEAVERHTEALRLAREIGDRHTEAETLNNLGDVYCDTGRADDALRCHEQAMAIAAEAVDPLDIAHGHHGIGNVLRERDPDAAREHWSRALAIYTDMGVPEADELRALLDEAGQRRHEDRGRER
ncbi:AfsR/SARP family transcriptional regulator [Rugosimonospora africana]|uniref:SARP family transcriptional regulator n=1 Tax=Rugosimonospora africana TaxID=556532 RepID=A0A8J3VQW4_9ACTN|nr:tetratricopeptide repeat protein [Rugosimonospora africana]GIH15550.1 SARP family transcriptional regulator [Rugosimonospora africana]